MAAPREISLLCVVVVLLVCSLLVQVSGQAKYTHYDRLVSGTGSEYITAVAAAKDGSAVYFGGYVTAALSSLNYGGSYGGQDFILVKYDNLGNRQWAAQYGSAGTDTMNGLVVSPVSDNPIACGQAYSVLLGNVYSTQYSNYGAYVIDFSYSGGYNSIFMYSYSGTTAQCNGVTVGSNGYVWAFSQSNGYFLGYNSIGGYDGYLMRWTSEGCLNCGPSVWQVATSSNDYPAGIATGPSGRMYLALYTTGTFDSLGTCSNNDCAYVLCYDTNANRIWSARISPGNAYDYAQGVSVSPIDESVYLSGYSTSTSTVDGLAILGGYTSFLTKFNSGGTKQWTRLQDTVTNDVGQGVVVDSAGFPYIVGYTQGSMGTFTNKGGYDMFMVQYDSFGNLSYTQMFGGTNDDKALGIDVYSVNAFNYIGGYALQNFEGNVFSSDNGVAAFQLYYPSCVMVPTVLPVPQVWINSTGIINSQLRVTIVSSVQYSSITINFLNGTSTACDHVMYEGESNWTETFSGCQINMVSALPSLAAVSQCMQQTEVGNSSVTTDEYLATILITTTQVLSPIRGTPQTRTISTAMRLKFVFQRFVNVSASFQSLNNPLGNIVISAVIDQAFDPVTLTTTVRLFTSLPWPFSLNSNGVLFSNNDLTPSILTLVSPSPSLPYFCNSTNVTANCEQVWQTVLTPSPGLCSYSGTLTFSFFGACASSYNGTCLSPSDQVNPTNITYTLAANDFCVQVTQDVSLSTVMNSFSDSNLLINTTTFSFYQRAYFAADVTAYATTGYTLPIASVSVQYVEVDSAGFRLPLYPNSTIGFYQIAPADPLHPYRGSFSFIVSPVTIQMANINEPQTVSVSAVLLVSYQGVSGALHHQLMRVSLQDADQSNTAYTVYDFTVESGQTSNSDSSSPISGVSSGALLIIAIVAASIAAVLVVAFVIYKRRTPSFSQQTKDTAPLPKEAAAL